MNNPPHVADDEFLDALRHEVKAALDGYEYSAPGNTIGNPMSDKSVQAGLDEMRAALVQPYWLDVELRDSFEQTKMATAPTRRGAVVADDHKGVLLLFDPVEEEYVLAQRTDRGFATFGVRGDAVGCFLAR